MRPFVALATLLQTSKAGLLPILVPRWLESVGKRDVVIVAVVNDADGRTRDMFDDACSNFPNVKGIVYAHADNVDEKVDDLELALEMKRDSETAIYWNAPLLHRMALLRESAREVLLKLEGPKGRRPDLFWWLDQDIDPRPHGFQMLLQDLTETTGPLAPGLVVGPYPTRIGGQDIAQWVEIGHLNQYVYQREGMVQSTRVAGFGCVLMRPDVLANVSWQNYGTWRRRRRMALELGVKVGGVIGEDVFFLRAYEATYGMTALQDNRARCRHYHEDGTFWRYAVDDQGRLAPEYCTDERVEDLAVYVQNIGPTAALDPSHGVCILSGQFEVVSPEVWRELKTRPDLDLVEVTAEHFQRQGNLHVGSDVLGQGLVTGGPYPPAKKVEA